MTDETLRERNRMYPHPHVPLGACRICVALERLATLDATRARSVPDDGLDAAWAEAEAALPEGWHIANLASDGADNPGWYVEARLGMFGDRLAASGPTLTEALRVLAAALSASPTETP